MLKRSALGVALCLTWVGLAWAQDQGHYDVSAAAGATIPIDSSGNGITLTPTKGTVLLGTGRIRFNRNSSFEFNYSRAKDSQIYTTQYQYRIQSNIIEYSGAYVYNFFQKGRFEPYALLGAGVLKFSAYATYINNYSYNYPVFIYTVPQTQIALIYGAGVDYRLRWRRFALRLQYRGLFYNAPNFGQQQFNTSSRGHLAEPSLGLVFRF